MRQILLLPGLDGTGQLLAAFHRAAPEGIKAAVVPLPLRSDSYRGLTEYLLHELDLQPQTVLVAESFSGPLAIALAARRPVGGLVLCNSFALPPAPRVLSVLARPWLFRLPIPAWGIRRYLVGPTADRTLVTAVRNAIREVPAAVLAGRLRGVLTVDAVPQLRAVRCPILYLRGTQDHLVPGASGALIHALTTAPVQITELPGPHLLLQAAPDLAWRAIVRFVAGLNGA